MKMMNAQTGQVIAESVELAHSFKKRLTGRMFTKTFPKGHAIHLQPCRQIHTFFMRYTIDVLYLDAEYVVVAIMEDLPAWKFGDLIEDADSVVELPSQTVQELNIKIGQTIVFNQ